MLLVIQRLPDLINNRRQEDGQRCQDCKHRLVVWRLARHRLGDEHHAIENNEHNPHEGGRKGEDDEQLDKLMN